MFNMGGILEAKDAQFVLYMLLKSGDSILTTQAVDKLKSSPLEHLQYSRFDESTGHILYNQNVGKLPANLPPQEVRDRVHHFLHTSGRMLQYRYGDDFCPAMAVPRIQDLIMRNRKPAFNAKAYIESVVHNTGSLKNRTFRCDGKALVPSPQHSEKEVPFGRPCRTRKRAREEEVQLATTKDTMNAYRTALYDALTGSLGPAHVEVMTIEEDERRRRGLPPPALNQTNCSRTFAAVYMDAKLGSMTKSVRSDTAGEVLADAEELLGCSMSWRYHHLLVKEYVFRLLRGRLDEYRAQHQARLEEEDARLLAKNVASLIRELSARSDTMVNFILEKEDGEELVHAYFDNDPVVSFFFFFLLFLLFNF